MVKEFDFAGAFRWDRLSELDEFKDNWESAEYQFNNSELEEQKKNLLSKVKRFLTFLSINTWLINGNITSIPKEWRYENPERHEQTTEKANHFAKEVYEQHQYFTSLVMRKKVSSQQ